MHELPPKRMVHLPYHSTEKEEPKLVVIDVNLTFEVKHGKFQCLQSLQICAYDV